jgi:hypothetical protein
MGEEPQLPKGKQWAIYGILALALGFAFIPDSFFNSGVFGPVHRAEASHEISQILTACLGYYTEYGEMPESPENSQLVKSLSSDNPRKIPFLSPKSTQLNSKGEMIDPWGTPFRFTFASDSRVLVTSAGPDRMFGTADDLNP